MKISTTYTITNILKIASFQAIILIVALGLGDDFNFSWKKLFYISVVSILYGVLQIRYNRYVISRPDYKEPTAPKFSLKTWEEHQSDNVIGADGFGHAPLPDGTYIKIPQIGNVVIGNKVEIGSNTSIDRANMGSTIIGNGCRIDNLVQIAHGVEIGENTVLAGGVFVAGSTKIGSNCVFAGQSGIVGHITVANGTQLGGQAGINKDITEPNGIYTGSPHQSFKEEMKSRVLWRNLPKLEQRVRELEQQLKSNK